MHCLWVALIFSPWILFNVDGAAVTNFYNSFTNKKFGGESSCVTETDVSASFGVEGENVRQKTEKKHFSGVSTACLNLCNGDSDCGGFWLESSYPNPVFTCKTVEKTCDLSVDNLVTASQGIIFLVKA